MDVLTRFITTIALVVVSGCENQPRTAEEADSLTPSTSSAAGNGAPAADADPRVAAFLDEGDAKYQSARWVEAAQAYSAALEIEPGNASAAEGLNASLAQLDQLGRIDEVARVLELRASAAIAEFDAGYRRSLEALERHELTLARGSILHARATLLRNQELIPARQFQDRDAKAAELLLSIDRIEELQKQPGG